MSYISAGAKLDTGDGEPQWIKTKKALKEALKNNPGDVLIVNLSAALTGEWAQPEYRANEMPEGVTAQVAGPDPERRRNWFASVKIVDGEAKVTA